MSSWVFQVFVFRDGEFLGTEMAAGGRFELGRDAACAVSIQDDQASRRHFQVQVQGSDVVLTDLGSANGTFVNGTRITTPVVISGRDDVRVGRHTFKIKAVNQQPAAAPAQVFDPSQTNPAMAPAQAPPQEQATKLVTVSPALLQNIAAQAAAAQQQQLAAQQQQLQQQQLQQQQAQAPARGRTASTPAVRRHDDELTEEEMVIPQRGAPQGMPYSGRPGNVQPQPVPSRSAPPPPPPNSDSTAVVPAPTAWQPVPAPPAARTTTQGMPPAGYPSTPPMAQPQMPPMAQPQMPPMAQPQMPPMAQPQMPPMAQPQMPPVAPAQPSELHQELFGHAAAAHDDDDEDDEHDDDGVFFEFNLVDHLAKERRLQGTRAVTEVMQLEGDGLRSYAGLTKGGKHKIRLPSPDGEKQGKQHLLVKSLADGAEIRPPPGMTGRVMTGGAAQDLQQMASTGKVVIRQGEGASLKLGNAAYFVRVSAAPARIEDAARSIPDGAALKRLDRKVLGISAGGSLGTHGLLILVMFIASLLSPNTKVTQLEDEFAEVKMPEVQLEPPPEPEPEPPKEAEPPPPPPDKTPKPMQKVPKARPTSSKPNTAAPEAPAPKPGILAALTKLPQSKNAGSQTVLAAVSNINAVKVPGGQTGFKVSALIGKGPANGIQIGGSGGGVATKGLTSILREGGAGVMGGKGSGVVRAAPAMAMHRQATMQGELSREEISKVINQHLGEIQFCYEKELLRSPGLQGKVVFEWTIKQDGKVLVVKTKVGQLPSAAATNCMIDKIKMWQFPKPRGNGVVLVTYPFVFKQSGF